MDVLQAILNRRSVRAYSDQPIPEAVMEHLLTALRCAPSACNFQPWRFVLVKDSTLRRELAHACHKQDWMAQAPVTVVACGYPDRAYKAMGGRSNSVDVDLAIALDHLSLAAVAEGLGTCWIGAFDEDAVKRLLGIPDEVRVVALMPVGYPERPELNHPVSPERRKPPEQVFSEDRF